jgi:hypothetical protein
MDTVHENSETENVATENKSWRSLAATRRFLDAHEPTLEEELGNAHEWEGSHHRFADGHPTWRIFCAAETVMELEMLSLDAGDADIAACLGEGATVLYALHMSVLNREDRMRAIAETKAVCS